MSPALLFTLIVLIGVVVADQVLRRHVSQKLATLYEEGECQGLLDYLDTFLVSAFYPRYNRWRMRASALVQADRNSEAADCYRKLLEMKSSDEQRKDLVSKAFVFFLEQGDHVPAKELLGEIKGRGDPAFTTHAVILYDVVANHRYEYIDTMKEELEGAEGLRKMQLHYLLACQYRNSGDETSAAEQERLAATELGQIADG